MKLGRESTHAGSVIATARNQRPPHRLVASRLRECTRVFSESAVRNPENLIAWLERADLRANRFDPARHIPTESCHLRFADAHHRSCDVGCPPLQTPVKRGY